jgi:TonB-dependent SusC/RagA subfamily outer membrane receptor
MNVKRLLRSIPLASLFLFLSLYSSGQSIPINGKVTQGDGQPLNGVTVQVKGTKTFTTSQQDGSFSIVAPTAKSILVFSYIGFDTREIPVSGKTQIDVSLIPGGNSLQDVVVVGYGVQKKSDVTGAVTSISAKTLEERPSTNVLQALQGKAAGVNVATNMKPGELPAVTIRGNRSINFSNQPLYVIDGIPMVSALGVTSGSINDINTNDIASIEVLKDASATAIYGSRGSNGVILVTTKRGAKGKVTFTYDGTVSLDSYKSLTEWMDGGQWVDRWREALINGRSYQTTTNTNLNNAPTSWYPDPFLDATKMSLASDQNALRNVWAGI